MSIFGKNICHFLTFVLLSFLASCDSAPSLPPDTNNISQPYILNSPDNHQLREYVQILPDTETGYSIGDIVQPQLQDQFVPFPDKTFEPQSHQPYWGKIQLENRLPGAENHHEWVLNFSSTFTHLSLFKLAENGTWKPEVNGSFVPSYQKNFTPTKSGNWFKLALPPGEVVTLYFRGESERKALPPTFHVYVQPLSVYYDNLVETKTGNVLFTGFILMMLLYNLIKFFIVRDRSYIYYSGYLLMVVIYTAYSSDDLEDWIGGLVFTDHPSYFNLFKISLYVGLMCWLAFIRSFLDLEHLLPKWDRYFKYVIWLGLPLMVVFVFLAFRYHFSYVIDDRPTLFYIALVTLSGFVFIYPLYRTKDPKGYFITAGIAVICLGFLLTLFSRVFQTSFTVDYLKVCTLIEILIFSMGLAYRQRKQVEAKQQADFALRESQLHQQIEHQENLRLREMDDFKSHFFTNITHEFRTPLTVILGMGEQLSKVETDAEKKGMLGLIKRNGESLLRLINQLLDLAKLESNTLKINYVQGDVLAYLKYIAESLHSLANAQNVMLRVESDQASIVMDYDPERFLQIVHNLLSNAIKFTPSGGRVVLRAAVKHGDFENQHVLEKHLLLTVTDTGAGIPAEELPHLFERFFQAKNQEHAKAGGTGIGLSLASELVKAMGGDISVESEAGTGSTFLVKLPVTNEAAFADKTPQLALQNQAFPTLPKSMAPATPNDDSSLPQILLIEDNPDVVEYLTACLGNQYRLDFGYNGQAGIEKALETVPDLIVSDVMMPIKDGFEVLGILKNDERTSHIPIILLTAKADVPSRLSGLRRGADAYLSKPFNQEELLVTVKNLLELRRKLQEKYGRFEIGTPPNSPIHQFTNSPITDPEDAFLHKLRSVVEANLSDTDFEMPQLERALAMSRSQIYRKVKALTGKSPSLFIRSIRLHHGRHLLLTTDLTVSEIAYDVGYSAPSNFSDAFLEEFGERPGKVRG